MRIQKIHYNAIINDTYLSEKARDDSFIPITMPSQDYKTWRAVLDLKTCFNCADNHGRIFDMNYTPGKRNRHRILWSNDGLIFVTYDHYHTFYEIV